MFGRFIGWGGAVFIFFLCGCEENNAKSDLYRKKHAKQYDYKALIKHNDIGLPLSVGAVGAVGAVRTVI